MFIEYPEQFAPLVKKGHIMIFEDFFLLMPLNAAVKTLHDSINETKLLGIMIRPFFLRGEIAFCIFRSYSLSQRIIHHIKLYQSVLLDKLASFSIESHAVFNPG